ncbi:spore gernimation protein [Tumebacillus avium]|uniref:Spore gernimation protein n=1 Tax=Tumebacillus avium TaxID=1903704 RepID=A0A1Y0IKE2_9BACL|nr:GerAB/ArcD/ProY family transporter [Tumebacillus avium]ARU59903.1 spore gernimation protein [Tumebacillus avium]
MKIRITNGMLMALVINMVYAKAIGLTQGIMARESLSDMWIATLFSTLQGVFIMYITVVTTQRLPDSNLVEQYGALFGKWAEKLIALVLFCFFLGAFGSVMITFVYHLMDYFLPEMPIIMFVLAGLTVGVYAIYKGLEVVARMALVGVFSIIALNVMLMIGSLHEFDIRELLPVFQTGFVNTVKTSRHNDTDWAMATLMTAFILPLVKDKKIWRKSGPVSILYAGLFVLMWPILEAGVLSPEMTGRYIVACMQLARSAEIGQFIHRYEMIMIAFFATSALVQTMVSLFCASLSVTHLFGLKDYRPTILPVALILGAFGYWVVLDHNRAMTLLDDYWPMVALPIGFAVPLLLWGAGFLFKKKLKKLREKAEQEKQPETAKQSA